MNADKDFRSVILQRHAAMLSIILNRPHAINSLNNEMVCLIAKGLKEAFADETCRFVMFTGAGTKGFCAGGDIQELARAAKANDQELLKRFFEEEFSMDLMIHEAPKPVVVIADGVTMGGGLGIAAGADIIIATERSRMAMPESRIGFFPDVGSTGWLFRRCRKGYPEYLALTGYYMTGSECVRLGLATHLVDSGRVPEIVSILQSFKPAAAGNDGLLAEILNKLDEFIIRDIPQNKAMDEWVAEYFAGKSSLNDILVPLMQCSTEKNLCDEVFASISERSPTSLSATLKLLRYNEGKPMKEVFAKELKAALFLTRYPDFAEGVRARLIDKDDKPRWQPERLELVDPDSLDF
ncbi:MAG: 3-hydroxyisobutyryl-CoA hydrolase [Syntrophus sp. SKADARSKE-3]|nr:3-hydroxyisobutyryl-CoA hydrolase [Syntrophus sp. SKADARSKE-3]